MATAYPSHPVSSADRLGLTFCLAVLFHALLILGIAFKPALSKMPEFESLEVVLVQSESAQAPEDADLLAQANHIGGGDETENVRAATPFASPQPSAMVAIPMAPRPMPMPLPQITPQVAELEAPPQPVIEKTPPPKAKTPAAEQAVIATDAAAPEQVAEAESSRQKPEPAPADEVAPDKQETAEMLAMANPAPSAAALVARSFAMASLDAEIDQRLEQKNKRPRRKFVSASTKEYKFAAYMEAFRAKVERVGNLNYPDEARRQKMSGSLILDVALNQDGSINEITVRRPSGKKVLDDAAVRIVRMAAPYSPFPAHISEAIDILHITRTWQFLSSDQFAMSRR